MPNIYSFHLRSIYQLISKVRVDGSWVHSQAELEDFHGHFANLIGMPAHRTHTLDLDFLNVPSLDLLALDASFSETEVWEAIKSLASGKAPRPDGFTGFLPTVLGVHKDRRYGVIPVPRSLDRE